MKKIGRIILVFVGIVVLVIISALSYVKIALPKAGEIENLSVKVNDQTVSRGEYLANHVMVCMDCHSKRDWKKFSGPLVPGTLGQGGEVFNQNMGFPGRYTAKNITPHNLSTWSDGEIFRAITEGISKDGSALFPIMPYTHYGTLDRSDIEAVIAYIRSLAPLESEIVESQSDFPMSFIINTIPGEAQFTTRPEKANEIAYGEYMVNAAGCYDCHTKQEKGEYIGESFAGGMEFLMFDGSMLRSPNITPHESGIGLWTEEQFLEKFKSFSSDQFTAYTVPDGEFQTVMPWTMYSGMEDEDIRAIFSYLQSIPPIENEVITFTSSEN